MRARRAVPAGQSGVVRVQTSGSESRRIDIKCYIPRERKGTRVPLRWWNQKGIDWETAKARGEEEGEETDSISGSGSRVTENFSLAWFGQSRSFSCF